MTYCFPFSQQKLHVLTNFREFYKQAASELRITKSVRYNCKTHLPTFITTFDLFRPCYFAAFDSNVVIVDKNDVQDFLGTLDYCYKKATPVATNSSRM